LKKSLNDEVAKVEEVLEANEEKEYKKAM